MQFELSLNVDYIETTVRLKCKISLKTLSVGSR